MGAVQVQQKGAGQLGEQRVYVGICLDQDAGAVVDRGEVHQERARCGADGHRSKCGGEVNMRRGCRTWQTMHRRRADVR